MSTPVTPHDFSEIRWKGHWIWVPEDKIDFGMGLPGMTAEPRKESHGLFRKTFTLASVPGRVPARITADSRYALYVNGQEVSRGPARSQPRRMMYDLVDLAPYLKAGENTIAVYVKYYGRANSFYIPAVPNSGLGKTGALVFEADLGPAGWLVSDDSWKATKSHAWDVEELPGFDLMGGGVPVEQLDAAKLPVGWQGTGFDDGAWQTAQLLRAVHIGGFARSQPPTDPYGPLYPRPIAQLGGAVVAPASIQTESLQGAVDASRPGPGARVVASMALPAGPAQTAGRLPVTVKIEAGRPVRLLADFGRVVAGLVQLEVSAPAGTIFELSYVEDPLTGKEQGMFAPHNGSRYIARGTDDAFEAFDVNGLRRIYLVIHGARGPVTVNRLAVREMIYPWTPGTSFECSDPELNALYKAGIRTVNLNSFDAFTDCPTREQRAWAGDGVVHQMVHLATNTDWRLAWQYLNLGSSPRSDGILPMSVAGEIEASGGITIPDWSLHWVHGVYNLYRFQGDRAKVKTYMPVVERILRWYTPYQTQAGVLKDVIEWDLVDWAALFVEDTSSILTAIWARGLKEFMEMAGWLRENASRDWAEGLYAQAKAGYEMFWDEARGTYVDHITNGVQQKPISQVAGALAIVSGLAPKERWARIAETITDPEKLVVRSWTGGESGDYSPEKMQKQFMGIYEADWDTERQIVIGEPFISYLVHDAVAEAGLAHKLPELYRRWSQFLVNGYDTIGECWGWGTHVHGWSCTPTKDMIFYTLGVTPAEPGYAAARIASQLGHLAWAEGKVPTPHGLISVRAEPGQVTVDSPIPVIVELPGQAPRRLPAGAHQVRVT
jgi:Bacterial alpha-L-rhamnosidase 6 hairpin glycosidase domain/Alpha-L-rhamnosidase N-terminal domain